MSAHEILIWIMAIFAVLGAIDRIFGNRIGILTKLLNVLSVVWIVAAHRRTKLHTVLDSGCACSIVIHLSFSLKIKYLATG